MFNPVGKSLAGRMQMLAVAFLFTGLAGCTSVQPVAYSGLASSAQLRPAPRKGADKVPFVYASDVNWRRYYKAIIEPVSIYEGPDAQFGKIPPDEQAELADYMDAQFREKLGGVFEVVSRPDRSTLRIHLTLTGASPTKAVLGTFSRFDLAGGPYNAFQGIRGKEGTLTGSVIYAVEIYDASNNRLLLSQVTKQYPNALNIGASFGALGAAKVGIRKGAEELVEQLTRNASAP